MDNQQIIKQLKDNYYWEILEQNYKMYNLFINLYLFLIVIFQLYKK